MQQSNKTIDTTRKITSISTYTVKIQLFIKKKIKLLFSELFDAFKSYCYNKTKLSASSFIRNNKKVK